MAFYDNYLNRINKNGNTSQERILTSKEREFNELTLPKSIYLSTIKKVNDINAQEQCVLQPNKYNQEKEVNNLMVKKTYSSLKVGDQLEVSHKIGNRERVTQLLLTFHENNITYGYIKYEGICLDDEFTIKNAYDEQITKFYCKIFNANNKFFIDNFTSKNNVLLKSATENRITIVCRDNSLLKKGLYVEFGGMGWRIEGIDRISIPNIANLSLEETLIVPKDDIDNKELEINDDTNFWLQGMDGDNK